MTQVILHEHRFNPEYEHVIHDRKLAEQRAEQLKSEAEAASQESLRNLETARGQVASTIAAADGRLKQAQLGADAAYYAQQQNAEAILAERTAKAKAIAKRNEALRGSGGRAMVKLKVAEAIDGKSIVLVRVARRAPPSTGSTSTSWWMPSRMNRPRRPGPRLRRAPRLLRLTRTSSGGRRYDMRDDRPDRVDDEVVQRAVRGDEAAPVVEIGLVVDQRACRRRRSCGRPRAARIASGPQVSQIFVRPPV